MSIDHAQDTIMPGKVLSFEGEGFDLVDQLLGGPASSATGEDAIESFDPKHPSVGGDGPGDPIRAEGQAVSGPEDDRGILVNLATYS